MPLKDNRMIFILVAVVVLLTIPLIFVLKSKKGSSGKKIGSQQGVKKEAVVLKDVKVSVNKAKRKGAILLSISNIPDKTESIEYELTYPTKDKGLQGVIGTIDEFEGSTYTKEIFLGTCSSGTCIEHKVDGPISVILRFKGSYGEEVLEREFKI